MRKLFNWVSQKCKNGAAIAAWLLAIMLLGSTPSAYCASKTLLVLGDSLSAEYGLARGTGWVALLQARLQQKNYKLNIVNASISGETSSGGKTRLPALLAKHQPEYLIIELGGNDGLRGLPIKSFQNNLQSMVKQAQQAGAKVLLLGMQIPPNYGREYANAFSNSYQTIAKTNQTMLVPFMLEGIADKPELFQADRIHPLAKSHPAILDNLWPQIELMLKAK